MELIYKKANRISLVDDPNFNEKWLQEKIANDPSILGLGDLILKDKERNQPHAGRLDLLFQNQDTDELIRYEVEIQLGKLNESHIIRTIEYWDIERKRYPQYQHIAVIIAEDITSRFLNIINLFNGSIPLIAIQLNAVKIDDTISLIFTKVIDKIALGLIEDDESYEITDRNYWEQKGTKQTVLIVDKILDLIKENISKGIELKYNKYYIGLSIKGKANNFVWFQPQKNSLKFVIKIDREDDIDKKLEQFDYKYNAYSNSYEIRINNINDLNDHKELFIEILKYSAQQIYDSQVE